MWRTGIVVVLSCLVSACSAPDVQQSVPALQTDPGPESLQEIEQTVSAAMGGAKITLAEDVLTKSSVLVIEHAMQRGLDRPPELGRNTGRPYRFQLVIDDSKCMLVDQQTGQHWPLTDVGCIEEERLE